MANINNLKKQLQPFVERIEKLEEEKKGIADDIKDIYAEIKSNGLDGKTVKETIKLRKLTAEARMEREFIRDSYLRALGLISEEE